MERLKCQVLLDAKTQDPEWVMSVSSCSLTQPLLPKVLECLVSALLWVQQHRKSKPSTLQCQLAVTSPSLAFLSCHSAFLSLGSVCHCTEAANPSWLPVPPSPGSCCCSQPWMCLCAQVSTSRPGNLACHSLVTFLGEGRAMCAVPAGNLPGFSHGYWLLGALILGNRLSLFFFKRPIFSCEIL